MDNLSLVLQLLLDPKEKARTLKGIQEISDALGTLGSDGGSKGKGRGRVASAAKADAAEIVASAKQRKTAVVAEVSAESAAIIALAKKNKKSVVDAANGAGTESIAAYKRRALAAEKLEKEITWITIAEGKRRAKARNAAGGSSASNRFDTHRGTAPKDQSRITDLTGKTLKEREVIVAGLMKTAAAEQLSITQQANARQIATEKVYQAKIKELEKDGFEATKEMVQARAKVLMETSVSNAIRNERIDAAVKAQRIDKEDPGGNKNRTIKPGWVEVLSQEAQKEANDIEAHRKAQMEGGGVVSDRLSPVNPGEGWRDVSDAEKKVLLLSGAWREVTDEEKKALEVVKLVEAELKKSGYQQKNPTERQKELLLDRSSALGILNRTQTIPSVANTGTNPVIGGKTSAVADTSMAKFMAAFSQRFKLDEKAKRMVDLFSGKKVSEDQLNEYSKSEQVLKDVAEAEKAALTGMDALAAGVATGGQGMKRFGQDTRAMDAEIEEMGQAFGLTKEQVEGMTAAQWDQGKALLAQESNLKHLRTELRNANREASLLMRASQRLSMLGRTLTMGGMAVLGTGFALANREAQRQQEKSLRAPGSAGRTPMDAASKQWIENNRRIELSMQRIARVFEREMLPYFTKAAEFAERASKYIEAHPELVKAAMSIGALSILVGTVVALAGTGIRMIADWKYIAANAAFDLAVRKHEKAIDKFALSVIASDLKGSAASKVVGGGMSFAGRAAATTAAGTTVAEGAAVVTGAATAGLAATVATVVAVVLAGGVIGTAGYAFIRKMFPKLGLTSLGDIATGGANLVGQGLGKASVAVGLNTQDEANKKTLTFTYLVGRLTGVIKAGDPAWESVRKNAGLAAKALDKLGKSEQELALDAEAWKVVRDLERENLAAEREYNKAKADILKTADDALHEAGRNAYANAHAIRKQLKESLGSLYQDFTKSNVDAERQYQQERANIIEQGNEQVRQINMKAQEDLRRLEEEHLARLVDIKANRDALGFVRENEEYDKAKNEIRSAKQKEIAEQRRAQAIQLRDLQVAHNRERAERLAQYNQAVLETRQQAQQALNDNAQQYKEQVALIAQQKAQQLADLLRSFNEERRLRIQNAYNAIKDIGTGLEAERFLRLRYYGMIVNDANVFMVNYQKALALGAARANGSGAGGGLKPVYPGAAEGGYVQKGVYQLHANEWVATAATTKALESLVGGRLTQANVSRGGSGASVMWNDYRTFSGEYTPAMKDAVTKDTYALLESVLRPA